MAGTGMRLWRHSSDVTLRNELPQIKKLTLFTWGVTWRFSSSSPVLVSWYTLHNLSISGAVISIRSPSSIRSISFCRILSLIILPLWSKLFLTGFLETAEYVCSLLVLVLLNGSLESFWKNRPCLVIHKMTEKYLLPRKYDFSWHSRFQRNFWSSLALHKLLHKLTKRRGTDVNILLYL